MWTRFTERARRTVFYAQEEAAKRGHSEVDALHLLFALLREPGDSVGKILANLQVDPSRLGERVNESFPSDLATDGEMQLATSGKRVIDGAFTEAIRLKQSNIGTEHILLGIAAHPGPAASVLAESGMTLDALREQVEAQLPPASPPR